MQYAVAHFVQCTEVNMKTKRPTVEVEVEQYYRGTAMCYKAYGDRSKRKSKPLIWACPSDFMVLPTQYTDLKQLRLQTKQRVKSAKLADTARPEDGLQTPRCSEWDAQSLDSEVLVLLGPNLSVEDATRSLEAVLENIRQHGLTVARIDQHGDYQPAFERVGTR